MTQLSIVVACFGRTDLLEESLVAVLQHRPADSEIVVVHDGRYADPYDLKDEVRFVTVPSGSGWVESLEAGWRAAHGTVIHLLGAGVVPDEGWTEGVTTEFLDPAVGAVVPVVREASRPERLRCVGVDLGPMLGHRLIAAGRLDDPSRIARCRPLGPSLAAAFVRRQALVDVGGLSSEFGDDLADLDLARRLEEAGYDVAVAKESGLRADQVDRPARRWTDRGRAHQRLIRSWPGIANWRRPMASLWQMAIETLASPRDPRRLASVWGRLSELRRGAEPTAVDTDESAQVLSLDDHRPRRESSERAESRRRAA